MRKFFIKSFLLVMITVVPLISFNFLIDPLQCFRVAKWYKPLYDSNERVQSGCLARSHDYDTVIAGSSHVENIDPAYIDELFGGSSVRLTIAASTLYEQNKVLNLAVQTRKVRTVIWGLDTNILYDQPDRVRDDITFFPYYIYEPSILNNLLFLLDPYQIKFYAKMIVHRLTGKYSEFTDLRRLNSWENMFTFSAERAWQAYYAVRGGEMSAMQNTNEDLTVEDLNNIPTENIDRNVIDLVKNNPDTQFFIYFPPYSILRFIELEQNRSGQLAAEWRLKEYLISRLLSFENVDLFDFQAVKEITHDLDNYKDLTHYSGEVDKHIIASLLQREHLITSSSTLSSALIRGQIKDFGPPM